MGVIKKIFGDLFGAEKNNFETNLVNNHNTLNLHDDVLSELEFQATLQIRTPLRVLVKNGIIHADKNSGPPSFAKEDWEGCWSIRTKTWKELGINMPEMEDDISASDIGPVISSEYIPFLKEIRKIAEGLDSPNSRAFKIRIYRFKKEWMPYVDRHGGIDNVVNKLFPLFVDTIPGLNKETRDVFYSLGITTANKFLNTPDDELLNIKGVGKAKLLKIKAYCERINTYRDSERLENVIR